MRAQNGVPKLANMIRTDLKFWEIHTSWSWKIEFHSKLPFGALNWKNMVTFCSWNHKSKMLYILSKIEIQLQSTRNWHTGATFWAFFWSKSTKCQLSMEKINIIAILEILSIVDKFDLSGILILGAPRCSWAHLKS